MSDPATLGQTFHRHVEETVVASLRARLDAYVEALQDAIDDIRAVAREDPTTEPTAPGDAPEPDAAAAAETAPAETREARADAERRLRYAERFHGRFGPGLFGRAVEARAELFDRLTAAVKPGSEPTRTARLPSLEDAPPAPELVRPGPWQRLLARARPGEEREVPVSRLEATYLAELSRRLEPMVSGAARLMSVAVAEIRSELHEHTDLKHDDASAPGLGAAADQVANRLEAIATEVQEEYDRALRASSIRVPEESAGVRQRATSRRTDLLEAWSDFEQAVMANVSSEAVLARALAGMEAAVGHAAGELETVRAHRGAEPLDRLAEAMRELGARAERELDGAPAEALDALADEADRRFEAELPRLRALLPRIREHADRLTEELAAIPGAVPDDLRISEHAVPTLPERPRKLELREAPLEALLSTACAGALPRWLERSVATAGEELEALIQEVERARHAVAFQLRAPLRGGFDEAETRALVEGITARTAAQMEDLRTQGLASIGEMVRGVEERVRAEAETLRSAVANREFLRIHSEIAEEEAVRQLTTGVKRARQVAGAIGRGAGTALGAGRRVITAVQDWAQRQLGVGEVEREEMLESLEQSLLGQDQQVVALPAIYRQLFDVEADVPWDELLVPRSAELEVIRRAFDRWVEDRSATVAIVGEKGSGKTTLLRLAEQRIFADTRVVRATPGRSIDDPDELLHRLAAAFGLDDAAELADRINGQQPAVAVVEDLHHLFVRALGGFDALEAFLELVSATRGNVLWVVTVDEFAWQYLSRVVGLAAHFVHTVRTTELSPEELEAAIMARHDVSGFALRFDTEVPDRQGGLWARLAGRTSKGELSRKETQRRRYFRQLADIAEGNIVLALFYWLRSIREVDEHVLVLGEPKIIELEFLDRLPLAQLHTLAAIILHGGVSEPAHRRIFQLPAVESRLLLASLADSHMVFRSSDGEYKINKVLYRPFIRMFVSKNIF